MFDNMATVYVNKQLYCWRNAVAVGELVQLGSVELFIVELDALVITIVIDVWRAPSANDDHNYSTNEEMNG